MTREEQLKFCAVCNHRKMDMKQGLLCDLTNAKADFEEKCENYEEDAAEKRKQVVVEEFREKERREYSGAAKLYLFFTGLGAILTLLLSVLNLNRANYGDNTWLFASDAIFLIGYVLLSVYTIVAFLRFMPNAVTLGKIQLFFLLANKVLMTFLLFAFSADISYFNHPVGLIISILWGCGFLYYLYASDEMLEKFPKEKRHLFIVDKVLIGASILAVVVSFSVGCMNLEKNTSDIKNEAEFAKMVKLANRELPRTIDGNLVCEEMYLEDDAYVVQVTWRSENADDYTEEDLERAGMNLKEIMRADLEGLTSDPLIQGCIDLDYTLVYRFLDAHRKLLFIIEFSPEELSGKAY